MMQTSLFNHFPEAGRSRKRDPATSKAAAKTVSVADLEQKVLDALRRHADGLTTHQLAEYLDIPLVSVSPRMAPLRAKELVVDSGERRKGPSGVKSIVWKVV
jgi:hypothetical protein